MEPVSVGLYPRNTTAVKTALLDLSKGRPEGIIMVGAYDPIGEFVLWAKETNLVDDAKFIAISFVGSNALAKKLGPQGEGVYVTQSSPSPPTPPYPSFPTTSRPFPISTPPQSPVSYPSRATWPAVWPSPGWSVAGRT